MFCNFNFFKCKRIESEQYYTITEVQKLLKDTPINPKVINNKVAMLYAFGFLEVRVRKGKGQRMGRREFRFAKNF